MFNVKKSSIRQDALSKNNRKRSFNEILFDSIAEAFISLGENVRASNFHLEKIFMAKRQHIPYDMDGFSEAFERIFGLSAQYIELLIMKKLNQKVSNKYRWKGPRRLVPDLTFREYGVK